MPDPREHDQPAAEAAAALTGTVPGLLLLGPPSRTIRTILQIQDRLDPNRLLPVPCHSDAATPDDLRRDAERSFLSRPAPDTELLITVPEADRLSAAMLRELDDAAAAAEPRGGFKLLLAAEADPRPRFERDGFAALFRAVSRAVVVPAAAPPDPAGGSPITGAAGPERLAPERLVAKRTPHRPGEPAATAEPPRIGRLVLLALAALVVATAVILFLLPDRTAPPANDAPVQPVPAPAEPARPATPAPVVVAPPPASTTPPPAPAQPSPATGASTTSPAPANAAGGSEPTAVPSTSAVEPAAPPAPVPAQVPAPTSAAAPVATPAPGPTPGPVPEANPGPAAPSGTSGTSASPVPPAVPPTAPPGGGPTSHGSLLLLASPGDTLRGLYDQVYRGAAEPPSFASVSALNPVVRPGTRLVFPAPSAGWGNPPSR